MSSILKKINKNIEYSFISKEELQKIQNRIQEIEKELSCLVDSPTSENIEKMFALTLEMKKMKKRLEKYKKNIS